jgi:HTH-type transcriptional regulator/antitoxin HigA
MWIDPIRNEADNDKALGRIDELWNSKRGTPEGDELDALITLVEYFESKQYPMGVPEPIPYILFVMENRGLTRKDLEPMIGSRARVSEVLSGKRSLTLPMVRRLHEGLGIDADILIRPTKIKAIAKKPTKSKKATISVRQNRSLAARTNR